MKAAGTSFMTASHKELPDIFPSVDANTPNQNEINTPVAVRELLVLGADWGGLIVEAKQLLIANTIDLPQDDPSLGGLLRAFDDNWKGLLPSKAQNIARRADELLEIFASAQTSHITREDIQLFRRSLVSLHRIISITASKTRHPAHKRN